ncbi:MAG: hypothetical protein P8K08_21535 [Fuerstiella sp.]|nr:hypothetical protein [Fuerstiella sp.]
MADRISLIVRDIASATQLYDLWEQNNPVRSPAFSSDSRPLAATAGGGTIRLGDMKSGEQRTKIKTGRWGTYVRFSHHDGILHACSSLREAEQLDVNASAVEGTDRTTGGAIDHVSLINDGEVLVTIRASGAIVCHDTASGKQPDRHESEQKFSRSLFTLRNSRRGRIKRSHTRIQPGTTPLQIRKGLRTTPHRL